jgi:SAM-dependent methyltransferase
MSQPKCCDLCGGTRFEVICRRDRRGGPLDTVSCAGCGLVGHAVVPTEHELDDYYTNHYRRDYHGEAAPSRRRIWRAWRKGERLLRQLRPYLPAGARVFEVGSGTGCTVKVFELAGYDASGIEPSTGFQGYSRDQLRARVAYGSIFDYQAPAPYDLVLLVHVIEHMRSPRQTLAAIHRLLKPGGRLYLECPSLGKLHSDPAEHFHHAHIHTFTPLPLRTLLRQCGFVMEKCYSDGDGLNHKYLLTTADPVDCPVDPAGVAQTHDYLVRFRDGGHRFGPRYLAGRAERIGIYLQEYVWGGMAVRGILRRTRAA